jgi:ATP-dependent exoDNAse (exonuclease V) alpha subunit
VIKIIRDKDDPKVSIKLDNNKIVDVSVHTWDIQHNYFDKKTETIEKNVLGSFSQFPFRLAWAITIHKSQGKTFNNICVDLERTAFAYGQTYVALSRAVSYDGLWLARAIKKSDIRLDYKMVKALIQIQLVLDRRSSADVNFEQILKDAIKNKQKLEMVYIKANNVKSKRIITPIEIDKHRTYGVKNTEFNGLLAFCHTRNDDRVFNIDRISSLEKA